MLRVSASSGNPREFGLLDLGASRQRASGCSGNVQPSCSEISGRTRCWQESRGLNRSFAGLFPPQLSRRRLGGQKGLEGWTGTLGLLVLSLLGA